MKQVLSAALALMSLAVIPLLAGRRMVMESTDLTTNKATKQEILIDANRMKVDTPDTAMMFLTAGGSRMVVLDKSRNEFMVLDEATMKSMGQQIDSAMAQMEAAMKNMPPQQRAMMEQMMKGKMAGMPGAAAPAPSTVYTAKGKGTANGFACTNYEGKRGAEKVSEICAAAAAPVQLSASDLQLLDKMREFAQSLTSSVQGMFGGGNTGSGVTETGINGFPVQTTRFTNGKATSREDLKSVTTANFTDADFSTGNAKQRQLPQMGK